MVANAVWFTNFRRTNTGCVAMYINDTDTFNYQTWVSRGCLVQNFICKNETNGKLF